MTGEQLGPALQGITVLDLGQIYAAPYCAMLLRELGAAVVKVEPFDGEPIRWRSDGVDANPAFQLLNAGKRSLRVNLKRGEGRELLLELAAHADVVVENFGPGALERLGLGYEDLCGANPRIVLASAKGYGSTGPNSGMLGMDVTVQAMSGVVSTTGFPDQPPVKAGPAVADFAAGSHLVSAVLAALFQRERTGRGQHVEVSMQDATVPALTSNIAGFLEHGERFPDRTGNRHGGLNVVPYNIYPAADGWLAVLCVREAHWQRLCGLMSREDLGADDALRTARGRVERMNDVDQAVAEWAGRHGKDELAGLLRDAGIPAAPVRTLAEVVRDPHLWERGMLRQVGAGEACTALGSPLRMAGRAPEPAEPPRLGQHSDEVLTEVLGVTSGRLRELRDDQVI